MSDLREQVRVVIAEEVAGRRWCNVCESYEHECGCTPSVTERGIESAVNRIISALCDGLGITEELVTNLDHAACGCNCSLNCGIWCPVCATVATLRTLLDARGPSDE